MENNHTSRLVSIQQANFNELYKADSIIQLTIHSCQEREFAGQYYGATQEMKKKISEERNNYINMLTLMVEVLGSPRNTDFQQITNPSARKFMDALPKHGLGSFDDLFRKYDPVEVDLLRRMLTWNPEERITVEEILRHEFLSQFHDPFDEPVTLAMEDFEFERPEYSAQDLKRLLWQEIQKRR